MMQGGLYYLVVTPDQKAAGTNQTNAPIKKVIPNIQRKIDVIFDLRYFEVLRIVEET